MNFGGIGFGEIIVVIISVVIVMLPLWRIVAKIGYPGFLSILLVIPLANLIMLYFLAFSRWPLEKKQS